MPQDSPAQQQRPKVTQITDLSASEAKWVKLQKVDYIDGAGVSRSWEVATRTTRGKAGIDAVAIGNILLHPSKPASTMLVIQYRPPVDAYTVEWPAGLIDANETPEEAAVREMREETGYEGKVIEVGPTVASDPGMTSANLKLVMMEVRLKDDDGLPEQHLDEGEAIERVVVPLRELYDRLLQYSKQERTMVAGKLMYFAAGLRFAQNGKYI